MSEFGKTVFISYRRSVSRFLARSIFNSLRENGYDVFLDIESINAGEFKEIILQQISARMHFIVVLTEGSVERCLEPDDWLRREIEHAIKMQRNIVPITFDKFEFNDNRAYLTGDLSVLPQYNALPLYDSYFDEGMNKLIHRFLIPKDRIKKEAITSEANAIVERRLSIIENSPSPTKEQLSSERYFERAYSKHQAGNLEQAIEDYSRAIELSDDYIEAIYQRALAFEGLDQYEDALGDYNRVLELEPKMLRAIKSRGILRIKLDQTDEGIQDLMEASEVQYSIDASNLQKPDITDRERRLNPQSRPAALLLTRSAFKQIHEVLQRQITQTGSDFIGLTDSDGNIVSFAGTLGDYDLQLLASKLSKGTAAQDSLASLVNAKEFFATYYEAEAATIYLLKFNLKIPVTLVVISKPIVKVGMIMLFSKRSASLIDQILQNIPSPRRLPKLD